MSEQDPNMTVPRIEFSNVKYDPQTGEFSGFKVVDADVGPVVSAYSVGAVVFLGVAGSSKAALLGLSVSDAKSLLAELTQAIQGAAIAALLAESNTQ